MLGGALDSHPDLCCLGEKLGGGIAKELLKLRANDLGEGLIVHYTQIPGQKVSAFKGLKVISLVRLDLLQLAVSFHLMKNRGQYGWLVHLPRSPTRKVSFRNWPRHGNWYNHCHRAAKEFGSRKVKLSADSIRKLILHQGRLTLHWHKQVRKRSFTVTYEELSRGKDISIIPTRISKDLCQYLDVYTHPLVPPTKKVASLAYSDWVLNWDEIRGLEREYRTEYRECLLSLMS